MISRENRGRPVTRNEAFDLTRGRYLVPLDAVCMPERLERQVELHGIRPTCAVSARCRAAALSYHANREFGPMESAVFTPFGTLCCAVAVALLAFQQPAHAYIDPGTGSLILQGLVALVVGAIFTLKTFFYQRVRPVNEILRRPPAEPPVDATKD